MDDFFVKIPFSVSPAMEAALQRAQRDSYGAVSQTEMLQDLLRRGLQAARGSGSERSV